MVAADPARGQHFELLYQTAQAFNSSLDLAEIFRRVIAEVIEITRAERGFVILRQPDGSLHFSVAQDSDGNILTIPQQEISHTVIEEALKTGQPVLCQDAQCDGRFDAYSSVANLQLKSILCVPLACKVQIEGVIYVENRVQKGVFTERDLELLAAIAAGRHSVCYETERLLMEAVFPKIPGTVGFLNGEIEKRLDRHTRYVSERSAEKEFKYVNRHYRFPVMTRQETDIRLDPLLSIAPTNRAVFEAFYRTA